jgi:hypothetical protein
MVLNKFLIFPSSLLPFTGPRALHGLGEVQPGSVFGVLGQRRVDGLGTSPFGGADSPVAAGKGGREGGREGGRDGRSVPTSSFSPSHIYLSL